MVLTTQRSCDFVEEASLIGEELWRLHAETKRGDVFWYGPVGYGTERFPLRRVPIGGYLYHGAAGIALFFAALYCVAGDIEHRDRALLTLAPLRRALRSLTTSPEEVSPTLDMPVGGLIGAGSFVYSLLTIGSLLDDQSLVEEAREATRLLTPERIADDRHPRVQTGGAGAVLALVALHEKVPTGNGPGPDPIELAEACGFHLVSQCRAFEGLPRAWPLAPGKPPLPGYGYGAAGICHALLRLHEHSPRVQFLEAAREGLEFIRTLFSPGAGAWLDLREILRRRSPDMSPSEWKDWWASDDPDLPDASAGSRLALEDEIRKAGEEGAASGGCLSAWCHGAAGIALGRLASLDLLDDELDRKQVESGLEFTRSFAEPESFGAFEVDDLCCGYMGLVESLSRASQLTGDASLADSARQLAARVVDRARAAGGYTLSAARGTDQDVPMLFQGLAGVGYTLLRLEAPDELPCLLLFE